MVTKPTRKCITIYRRRRRRRRICCHRVVVAVVVVLNIFGPEIFVVAFDFASH